jgi:AAA ATPase domain
MIGKSHLNGVISLGCAALGACCTWECCTWREPELQQLTALWEKANRGEGQIALICGEAGIGKSHLCEFFLGRLVDRPHLTLRYQCSPCHLNSPFYPVISHLEHAFGFEPADTSDLKLKKLNAVCLELAKRRPTMFICTPGCCRFRYLSPSRCPSLPRSGRRIEHSTL